MSVSELAGLYTRVFNGEEDRIPLVVAPPCGEMPAPGAYVTDTAEAVRRAAEAMQPKREVGADWIPSVVIANYQATVVPSFFGAEPVTPPGSCAIVMPLFRTIEEAVDAGVPPPESRLYDEMMRVLRDAKAALPEGFHLSFPACACQATPSSTSRPHCCASSCCRSWPGSPTGSAS